MSPTKFDIPLSSSAVFDAAKRKKMERAEGREYDTKMLDEIERKTMLGERLTDEEKEERGWEDIDKNALGFLYGIHDEYILRSFEIADRMKELQAKRDKKKDIARALGVDEWQIITTREQMLRENGGEWFEGTLHLQDIVIAENLVLPRRIQGDLDLSQLRSAENVIFPEVITGYCALNSLSSAKNVLLPRVVLGGMNIGITSAQGVIFPKDVGPELSLKSLRSVEGLVLPADVEFTLFIEALPLAEHPKLRALYPRLKVFDCKKESWVPFGGEEVEE